MCNKAVERYHFLDFRSHGHFRGSGNSYKMRHFRESGESLQAARLLPVARSLPVDWGLVTEYCALIGYYLWQSERSRDPVTSKICKLGHVTLFPNTSIDFLALWLATTYCSHHYYYRNSISVIKSKFLSVSSMNTARHFESHWRETWRHIGRPTVPQISLGTPPPSVSAFMLFYFTVLKK